ncbi:hypothetical protein evm_009555 [Chilo suppressalis]|nr:hypothetical protein evm_009555 [Chilo suppressalis]
MPRTHKSVVLSQRNTEGTNLTSATVVSDVKVKQCIWITSWRGKNSITERQFKMPLKVQQTFSKRASISYHYVGRNGLFVWCHTQWDARGPTQHLWVPSQPPLQDDLATYNGRTLRLDSHLAQLEEELNHIRWHVLGLSEVRSEGEDTLTLESGHLMYFREGDNPSQGGVGFLVNKVLTDNVIEVSSVSTRVAYLIIKLTKRYSLKVIQVYAPTSTYSDDVVEEMYEDISRALHTTIKAHFNVVMGDFNAKVGVQTCSESMLGSYGYGSRNHRGQMLVNFLERERLFLMNSFFKK